MRVVCWSDFHGVIPGDVPECDVLVLAGDCLPHVQRDIVRFDSWLQRQPAKEIVGVAGNHDFVARDVPGLVRNLSWRYLEDEQARFTVDGRVVHVWGSPFSMPFNNWAFMAPEHLLEERWARIPAATEILVVHGPAYGINDLAGRDVHTGSISLRDRLRELPNLRLFVTGHIHEAYGWKGIKMPDGDFGRWVLCVNASLMDERYRPQGQPVTIDIDGDYLTVVPPT